MNAVKLGGRKNDVIFLRATERYKAELRLGPFHTIFGLGVAEGGAGFVGIFGVCLIPHFVFALVLQHGGPGADFPVFPRAIGNESSFVGLAGFVQSELGVVPLVDKILVEEELFAVEDIQN